MIEDAEREFLRRQFSHSFVSFSLLAPYRPAAGKMDAVSIFSNLATAGALSALLTAVLFVDILLWRSGLEMTPDEPALTAGLACLGVGVAGPL
jgi:hypothetical protein